MHALNLSPTDDAHHSRFRTSPQGGKAQWARPRRRPCPSWHWSSSFRAWSPSRRQRRRGARKNLHSHNTVSKFASKFVSKFVLKFASKFASKFVSKFMSASPLASRQVRTRIAGAQHIIRKCWIRPPHLGSRTGLGLPATSRGCSSQV